MRNSLKEKRREIESIFGIAATCSPNETLEK